MKKLFLLCFLAVGMSSIAFAQTTPTTTASATTDANKSEFKFNDESHDFGTLSKGSVCTYEFTFSNIGKEPLIISNVVPSCGCTTPSYSKEPVAPGQTGKIMVSYDSNRVGPFSKSITISSNSKTPTKTLFIKGTIIDKKAAGTL